MTGEQILLPKPYYENENGRLYCGEAEEVLPNIEPIHAIVCDPPYGIKFMGKAWDYQVPSVGTWKACYDALLPGGHLLSFAGTRTQHRMAVNIEDAGFEIRDMIAWVYGSGFPKSLDVSKAIDKLLGADREVIGDKIYGDGKSCHAVSERAMLLSAGKSQSGRTTHNPLTAPATDSAREWEGYGTALKPAMEPITVARKPIEGTVAENVLRHGCGGLNVDGCRVGNNAGWSYPNGRGGEGWHGRESLGTNLSIPIAATKGRFPANLIHDGSDEVVGLFPNSKSTGGINGGKLGKRIYGNFENKVIGQNAGGLGDSGSAARFFYCAKASKADRGEGNTHPTVKPQDLIRYLIKLVLPHGGIVLDPFGGSGTLGVVCQKYGWKWVMIERDIKSVEIAVKRIEHEREQLKLF